METSRSISGNKFPAYVRDHQVVFPDFFFDLELKNALKKLTSFFEKVTHYIKKTTFWFRFVFTKLVSLTFVMI